MKNRKIDPSEYMQSKDWNSCGLTVHPYKRGSLHNKIGMSIMWTFYGIVILQVLHAVTVIPFFPITFMMLLGLGFIFYVQWRAT